MQSQEKILSATRYMTQKTKSNIYLVHILKSQIKIQDQRDL